jgi:hypothetical protein
MLCFSIICSFSTKSEKKRVEQVLPGAGVGGDKEGGPWL